MTAAAEGLGGAGAPAVAVGAWLPGPAVPAALLPLALVFFLLELSPSPSHLLPRPYLPHANLERPSCRKQCLGSPPPSSHPLTFVSLRALQESVPLALSFPRQQSLLEGPGRAPLEPRFLEQFSPVVPQMISLGVAGGRERRSDSREPQCQTPGQRCPQPPGGRWTCSPVGSPHLSKPGILKQGPPVSFHTTRVGASQQVLFASSSSNLFPIHMFRAGEVPGPWGAVSFFHGVFPRQPLGEGQERAP